MSCTNCGSNTPCRCSQGSGTGSTCSCGNPGCYGCGCSSALPATPTPFYLCGAPTCPENHMQRVVLQQFYTTISLASTWNVPDCGEQAIVNVLGLKSAEPGSFIWNGTYGYFEVVSFDSSTGQLTIKNDCHAGNAAAGTTVPACTEFVVTVPPCECPDDTTICVSIDFTAPENGDCIDITLTTTQGLTASDTVQIGSGLYFVSAIKPNNVITICNQGQGITPGTPVIAGTAPNYNYCLGIVSTNPCDRTPADEAVLLGCNSDGVTAPLACDVIGWVPTAIRAADETSVDVACRPLGTAEECSVLSGALAIVSGTADYANVVVDNSAEFVVGDVIEFTYGGYIATITGIPDVTHLNLTFSPVPSLTRNIPDATMFCLQSCCDTLAAKVEDLSALTDSTGVTLTPAVLIDQGSPLYTSTHTTWSVVNPSSTKTMQLTTSMIAEIEGFCSYMFTPGGGYISVQGTLLFTVNGGGANTISFFQTNTVLDDASELDQSIFIPHTRTDSIAPGGTVSFDLWSTAEIVGFPGQFFINSVTLRESHLGVAVEP